MNNKFNEKDLIKILDDYDFYLNDIICFYIHDLKNDIWVYADYQNDLKNIDLDTFLSNLRNLQDWDSIKNHEDEDKEEIDYVLDNYTRHTSTDILGYFESDLSEDEDV